MQEIKFQHKNNNRNHLLLSELQHHQLLLEGNLMKFKHLEQKQQEQQKKKENVASEKVLQIMKRIGNSVKKLSPKQIVHDRISEM